MAKSTPSKKGATNKVATKDEIISADRKAQNQEPKKIKTVSIAKPKGLMSKVAKKTTPKTEEQAEKNVTKISKKQSEAEQKPISEKKGKTVAKNDKKDASPSKKGVSKKVKLDQSLDHVKGTTRVESTKKEPINKESKNSVNDTETPSESHGSEEKLSRKERRLREWKERKKLKRMQHLQEKQKSIGDLASESVGEDISVAESKDIPAKAEKHQSATKESPKQDNGKGPQESVQKQANTSKVVPLDKVGKDFPPIKKVETWGNSMSKAKVDALPKQLEPMLQKTIQFLEQEIRIKKPSTILVGVSGGIDSVVLLDLLSVISTRGWCTIHVAHCNHMLRGDASNQDEAFVRKLASKYGLHFHHTQADVSHYAKEYNLGTEIAARIMRYQFFEKAAKISHADVIATAHHAEDNAETLLMNLMRGSGVTGLAGIPPRRDVDKKLSYIRPILWLSKKEIEHYANVRSLEWREDESNASMNFTRNKIRHELLPLLRSDYSPGLTEVLNRTTTLMREAQEFIAERIIHIMKQGVRELSKSSFAINIGMFESIKDFAKGELIQASLRSYLHMQPISMNAIDSILAMAKGPAGGRLDITKELFVIRDREELVFSRPEQVVDIFMPIHKLGNFSSHGISYSGEIADPRSVNFGEHPLIEYFDADLLPEQLVIRYWRDGDRLTPIGMDGSMTVSDFLTNAKINIADKRKVLVLCSADEVLWVIGYRIHNGFKVTQKTEGIIRIKIMLDKAVNYLQQEKASKQVQKTPEKKSAEKSAKQAKAPVTPKNNQKAARKGESPSAVKKTKQVPEQKKKVEKSPKKPK